MRPRELDLLHRGGCTAAFYCSPGCIYSEGDLLYGSPCILRQCGCFTAAVALQWFTAVRLHLAWRTCFTAVVASQLFTAVRLLYGSSRTAMLYGSASASSLENLLYGSGRTAAVYGSAAESLLAT